MSTLARSEPRSVPRIVGKPVPLLAPAGGDVFVLVVGEAPGPRGADKSGYPFLGDAAGLHLYRALMRIGAISFSADISVMPWDGTFFADNAVRPTAHGIAMTNAFDRCPSDDGKRFRAPAKSELLSTANTTRLLNQIEELQRRGLKGVVTLGKVATRTMEHCSDILDSQTSKPLLVSLPHPSAQGLLSMAPNRGKGAKMADLQQQWADKCIAAVMQAGFQSARSDAQHSSRGEL